MSSYTIYIPRSLPKSYIPLIRRFFEKEVPQIEMKKFQIFNDLAECLHLLDDSPQNEEDVTERLAFIEAFRRTFGLTRGEKDLLKKDFHEFWEKVFIPKTRDEKRYKKFLEEYSYTSFVAGQYKDILFDVYKTFQIQKLRKP